MSDSVRPHRWQPTRLLCPWDSPSKNTGVGCHCLLQCMKVKSEREVAQSCLTLGHPMDYSLPSMGFSRQEDWSGVPFGRIKTKFLAQYPRAFSSKVLFPHDQTCSHAFRETNSLRRTMQIVECSLLPQRAQGRVSSKPRTPTSFCENLIYS